MRLGLCPCSANSGCTAKEHKCFFSMWCNAFVFAGLFAQVCPLNSGKKRKVSQQHKGKFHFAFSPPVVLFLYLLGVYGSDVCGCTQAHWCNFKHFNSNHSKMLDRAQKAILQLPGIANLKSSMPFLVRKTFI